MDTATLVNDQVDEGQHFVDQLRQSGIDIEVAFWVLPSAQGQWFLYIATSIVDDEGLAMAYRKVYGEYSNIPLRWLSRSDIKLVGCQNPIALDAIAYLDSNLPTRYGGRKLGNMIVEEAYIYPNPATS